MKYFFLLGGYDLEMVEIKNILQERGIPFLDNNLGWGAKLSDYKDTINNMKDKDKYIFVGVELIKDTEIDAIYKEVDHHNEKSNNKSSLEQVADLLDIELTRKQKIIAINDAEYIEGMRRMGATDEEINEIRRRDRSCQGVTEEDEDLAERSIIENKKVENVLIIVRSLTNSFSPVVDRLYPYERLIVYSPAEVCYYGKNARKIGEHFKEIYKSNAYYGGGENGYMGINVDGLKNADVEEIINEIKGKFNYSYHIFMFPFECRKNDKIITNIGEFEKKIDCQKWEQKELKIESALDYNQYRYFYDNVRKAIYTYVGDKQPTVLNYEYQKKGEYVISLKEKKNYEKECEKEYELEIEKITLKIYTTGVGIISFHLRNYKYKNECDILKINEYGRRIYPQFLSQGEKATTTIKDKFLADKLQIKFMGENIEDDFTIYDDISKVDEHRDNISEVIIKLLGDDKFDCRSCSSNKNTGKIEIAPIIDDRMFTICWYGSERMKFGPTADQIYINSFRVNEKCEKKYNYLGDDFWYKFIFVDGKDKGCRDYEMEEELLKEHTYTRWIDYGTLYGISRYSFVLLTTKLCKENEILLNHLKTMYYEMVCLVLAQRASILSFSNRVTEITKKGFDQESTNNIQNLRKDYINFTNKIYFREVTAQEQGIELYDKIVQSCRVDRDIKDLDTEIDGLHQYALLEEEGKKRKRDEMTNGLLTIITIVTSLFAIPSFLTGFFGMNVFGNIEGKSFRELIVDKYVLSQLVEMLLPVMPLSVIIIGIYFRKKIASELKFPVFLIGIAIFLFSILLIKGR